MIQLLPILMLTAADASALKVHDVLFSTEARLTQVVGKRLSPPREPGIRFFHPGYYEIWIDSPGPGMKHLRLELASLIGWKAYLSRLGLGVAHAKVSPQPVANSPIPLYRNKLAVTGVTGLPFGAGHKPWNVTFVEYAVANHARLKALKAQIKAQPVGEGRNRLIRSCYDWWSELDFSAP